MKFKYDVVRINSDTANQNEAARKWLVTLHDGSQIVWKDLCVGPLILSDTYLEEVTELLLGITPQDVEGCSKKELLPISSLENKKEIEQSILIHSASNTLKFFEKDAVDIKDGNQVDDVATYIETRSIFLGENNDYAVGRTSPWMLACDICNINSINVGKSDYYYLSHALIEMALHQDSGEDSSQLRSIISFLKNHPNTSIKIYALEYEMQVFLLWLKRIIGLPVLYVECNGLEVANNWNKKSTLYPSVEEALSADIPSFLCDQPYEVLNVETKLTKLYSDLRLNLPRLPGYVIFNKDRNNISLLEQVRMAAQLLKTRYGISQGCLKPADAGTGVRTISGIDLGDTKQLEHIFTNLYDIAQEDFILEAHVDYLSFEREGFRFSTSPSAHIRMNRVAEGISLQIMEGTCWEGNLFLDRSTCESFQITEKQYDSIQEIMNSFLYAFKRRCKDDPSYGLVIAGIDFAIGKIKGKFGDDIILATQDLNLRFHGAEFLRILQDSLDSKMRHVVTKVIRPSEKGSLDTLRSVTSNFKTPGIHCQTLVSIPNRWGLIAAYGSNPRESLRTLELLITTLQKEELVLQN